MAQLPEPKLRREAVEVPDWGGTFYINELPASEMERIISEVDFQAEPFKAGTAILAAALTNDAGEYFERDDIMKHPARVLRPLIDKNNEINGRFGSDEEAQEKK